MNQSSRLLARMPAWLLAVALGLSAGMAQRLVPASVGTDNTVAKSPGPIDHEVLERMPNIDRMLHLQPPGRNALAEEWWAFAIDVLSVDLGKRGSPGDFTSPMLPWLVHIARHSPPTIHRLYDSNKIASRTLGHLISFGFLPDWQDHLEDPETLLLRSSDALKHIASSRSPKAARSAFLEALRSVSDSGSSISASNLVFALEGLPSERKLEILRRLEKLQARDRIDLDPRSVRYLQISGHHQGRNELLRKFIRNGAVGSYANNRGMFGYAPDAVRLGMKEYLDPMIEDAPNNAGEPTNFYCAACGLALTTDGLTGAGLLDTLRTEGMPRIRRVGDLFVLESKGS